MGQELLWFAVAIAALALGADSAVRGIAGLGRARGASAFAVGTLVAAFGGSAPDVAVNVAAVAGGHPALALGNMIGGSIVNLGLLLGLAAVLRPLELGAPVHKPLAVSLAATVLALLAMSHNGRIGYLDGAVLVVGFVIALALVVRSGVSTAGGELRTQFEAEGETRGGLGLGLLRVAIGVAVLAWAARTGVEQAVALAARAGVSDLFAGLTFVALGSSLPQIVFGLVAALRGRGDVLLASVVGSNLMNLTLVLGLTAVWHPYPVATSLVQLELPVLLALSAMLYPLLRGDLRVSRGEGVVLLLAFAALQGVQWWSVLR
jgi:cation:H+ antiporter